MGKLETYEKRTRFQDRCNVLLTGLLGRRVVVGTLDRLSLIDAEYLTSVLEEIAAKTRGAS